MTFGLDCYDDVDDDVISFGHKNHFIHLPHKTKRNHFVFMVGKMHRWTV